MKKSAMEIINEKYGVVRYVDVDKSDRKDYIRFIDMTGTLYLATYSHGHQDKMQVYKLEGTTFE